MINDKKKTLILLLISLFLLIAGTVFFAPKEPIWDDNEIMAQALQGPKVWFDPIFGAYWRPLGLGLVYLSSINGVGSWGWSACIFTGICIWLTTLSSVSVIGGNFQRKAILPYVVLGVTLYWIMNPALAEVEIWLSARPDLALCVCASLAVWSSLSQSSVVKKNIAMALACGFAPLCKETGLFYGFLWCLAFVMCAKKENKSIGPAIWGTVCWVLSSGVRIYFLKLNHAWNAASPVSSQEWLGRWIESYGRYAWMILGDPCEQYPMASQNSWGFLGLILGFCAVIVLFFMAMKIIHSKNILWIWSFFSMISACILALISAAAETSHGSFLACRNMSPALAMIAPCLIFWCSMLELKYKIFIGLTCLGIGILTMNQARNSWATNEIFWEASYASKAQESLAITNAMAAYLRVENYKKVLSSYENYQKVHHDQKEESCLIRTYQAIAMYKENALQGGVEFDDYVPWISCDIRLLDIATINWLKGGKTLTALSSLEKALLEYSNDGHSKKELLLIQQRIQTIENFIKYSDQHEGMNSVH